MFLLILALFVYTISAEPQEKKPRPAPRRLAAVLTADPIVIDGDMSEAAWKTAAAVTDFVQAEPYEGKPATENTLVRVLYDLKNLYVGAYCFDTEPSKLTVNDLRRDFGTKETDVFGVSLDTFRDQRNTFNFYTNPGGAMRDEQAFDDGRFLNVNWDGIWEVTSRIQPDGWSVEMRIPFRTLRFNETVEQLFGLNFFRSIRRKNEQIYWSPVPRRYTLARASMAGDLANVTGVKPGRSLRLKPSAVARLDRGSDGPEGSKSDVDGHLGLDAKYGLTSTLTLDLTANPDFSQADVDTQQINLTRFDLFFPEKREFFLENEGFFHFGDLQGERGPNTQEETRLFYSRRIGLSAAGEPVPLVGGARLSGRLGPFTLGLLDLQQGEADQSPAANFSVVRVRRDIFANSDIGFMLVNRQSEGSRNYNRAFGIDSNFQFFDKLTLNAYAARTSSPDLRGDDTASKFGIEWKDNFARAQFVYTDVDRNFNPEVGFVQRTDFRQYRQVLSLFPRPRRNRFIREFEPHAILRYSTDQSGRLVTRDDHYGLYTNFHDGSRFELNMNRYFERLDQPFKIRKGFERFASVPRGDYLFAEYGMVYNSNRSAPLSGTLSFRSGDFYNGKKTNLQVGAYALNSPNLIVELTYGRNWIRLPGDRFNTDLAGLNVSYSFNTRTFLSAFVQYNSSTGKWTTNARMRLIHRPLSDIYLVYSEDNPTGVGRENFRALLLKYTHVLEF